MIHLLIYLSLLIRQVKLEMRLGFCIRRWRSVRDFTGARHALRNAFYYYFLKNSEDEISRLIHTQQLIAMDLKDQSARAMQQLGKVSPYIITRRCAQFASLKARNEACRKDIIEVYVKISSAGKRA